MSAPTKTEVALLAGTFQGSGGQPAVGSDMDVSGHHEIGLSLWLGRLSGTAHTAPWASLIVEGNPSASDNSMWATIAQLTLPAGASIASTTLNGAVSANATTLVVASATNIAAGDLLFLSHGTDTAKYEVVRVVSLSGTTITIEGNIFYAHDNGAGVTDQAEKVVIPALDVSGLSRVRAKLVNFSGQTVTGKATAMKTVF